MTTVQPSSFWNRALPTFLESTVFWLYLNYVGLVVRSIVETPLLSSSSWDPPLKLFTCSFIVDYIWRRFLCVGNCIDPGAPLIAIAQGKSRGNFWPVLISCVLSGVVAHFVSEAVSPVCYAKWHRNRGLLFCFLIEFAFDFVHQCRHAAFAILEGRFKKLARLESKFEKSKESNSQLASGEDTSGQDDVTKTSTSLSLLTMKARGIQATASFITASIVALGSHFATGGPNLNLTYTVMAALGHKDWSLLVVLGTANLLSAYLAGLYVNIEIVATPMEDLVDLPKGMLSPPLTDRILDSESPKLEMSETKKRR